MVGYMASTERKTSKITSWKPNKNQILVEPDGELFICHFDRIFDQPKLKVYNKFIIKKASYENQLDVITNYANFFMNFYDPDNELVMAYLKLKYALDKEKKFNKENMGAFIDFIYEVMFSTSMADKIIHMVEDNYLDDIESTNSEEKKKYVKNEKKHLESLEFTNQQIKVLLQISFGMKIMSPIMFHYFSINVIKFDKDTPIIFEFYQKLFEIFGHGTEYNLYAADDTLLSESVDKNIVESGIENGTLVSETIGYVTKHRSSDGSYYMLNPINMYNKLYVYVKAKVLDSNSHNSPIFEQREIFGVDVFTVINRFTKVVLISENMVKYKFNEHWNKKLKKYDENIIGFNKTIIKYQLSYFLKEQYKKNLTEVTNTKNSDGLSGIDKMAMNLAKLDEGAVVVSDINIEKTIARIKKLIDIEISDEEVAYYREHLVPSKIQIQLVYSYYTKYFGSYRDLNLLTRKDYINLVLLLKKKLLIELGYEKDDQGRVLQAALPYILTGNLEDKVNTRIIRNNKFISKIEESYLYQNLINTKYKLLQQIKPDYILSLLSTLINTRFTYVTYENPDLLGKEIEYSEDKISDELLFFLNSL